MHTHLYFFQIKSNSKRITGPDKRKPNSEWKEKDKRNYKKQRGSKIQ